MLFFEEVEKEKRNKRTKNHSTPFSFEVEFDSADADKELEAQALSASTPEDDANLFDAQPKPPKYWQGKVFKPELDDLEVDIDKQLPVSPNEPAAPVLNLTPPIAEETESLPDDLVLPGEKPHFSSGQEEKIPQALPPVVEKSKTRAKIKKHKIEKSKKKSIKPYRPEVDKKVPFWKKEVDFGALVLAIQNKFRKKEKDAKPETLGKPVPVPPVHVSSRTQTPKRAPELAETKPAAPRTPEVQDKPEPHTSPRTPKTGKKSKTKEHRKRATPTIIDPSKVKNKKGEKSIHELESEREKRKKKRLAKMQKDAASKSREEKKKAKKLAKEHKALLKKQKKREKEAAKEKNSEDKIPFGEQLPFIGGMLKASRLKKEEKEKKKKEVEKAPNIFERFKVTFRMWVAARSRQLQKNSIGLEISDDALRAIQIKDSTIRIYEQELPPEIVVDGILYDEAALTKELKAFWQDNKIPSKKVNFSLSNRLMTLKIVDIPTVDESMAVQALAMRAQEAIAPMDASKSIIDYSKLSRTGNQTSFQVVAADQSMVKAFAKAIEKAGLYSISCEIGGLAAVRALVIPRSPKEVHALINIGSGTTSIIMASGQDILFYRNINIGVSNFIEAISNKLGITIFEAQDVLKRSGIGATPVDRSLDQNVFTASRSAMREVSDHLAQEIAQTRNFYEAESSSDRPVSSWSLIGEGAEINGLDEQIVVFTNLPKPEPLRAWPGLEQIDNLETRAIAAGLAREHNMSLLPKMDARSFNVTLPGMRRKSKINLNESEKIAKDMARQHGLAKSKYSPKFFGIIVAIAILAGGFYYQKNIKIDIENTKSEIVRLEESQKANIQSGNIPVYSGPNKQDLDITATMILTNPNTKLLKDIVQATEANNSISDYTISAVASNFELKATADSEEAAEKFKTQLNKIPNIGQVSVKSNTATSTGNASVTYTIGGFTGISVGGG